MIIFLRIVLKKGQFFFVFQKFLLYFCTQSRMCGRNLFTNLKTDLIMKKILSTIGIVAVYIGLSYAIYSGFTAKPKNPMLAKNIEALTSNEGGGTNTQCPNHDYVPNRYIECQEITTKVVCTTNGEITVNGKIFTGNYKRNKEYFVLYAKYNCSGIQDGAYCDQNRVRIELISVNK